MTKVRSFLVYFTLSYLVVGLVLVLLVYGHRAEEVVAQTQQFLKGNFQALWGSLLAIAAIGWTGKSLRKLLNWFVN